MLVPVDVLENTRRSVRRAVSIDCDLWSPEGKNRIRRRATNLSFGGVWLEGELDLGPCDPVWIELVPPGDVLPIIVSGVVRRKVLRRRWTDVEPSGVGIAFDPLPDELRRALEESLIGRPPPLRGALRCEPRWDVVWVVDADEDEDELDAEPLPLARTIGRR